MIRKQRRRSDYPPVPCCIPGCTATTRTIPPPCEAMICRKCWRRAPKRHRDFFSRIEARLTRARNRNSDEVPRFERLREYAFRRVHQSLIEEPAGDDLPELLIEELRKVGLA